MTQIIDARSGIFNLFLEYLNGLVLDKLDLLENPNSDYGAREILLPVLAAAVQNYSITEVINQWNSNYLGNDPSCAPLLPVLGEGVPVHVMDRKTILRRIKGVGIEKVKDFGKQVFKDIMEEVHHLIPGSGAFYLICDCNKNEFYGKPNIWTTRGKASRGTTRYYQFTSCMVAFGNVAFTSAINMQGNGKSWIEVVNATIKGSQSLHACQIVLVDREFFSVASLDSIKSRGMHFLMPAKKTAKTKKIIDEMEAHQASCEIHRNFKMKGKGGSERYNLIVIKKELVIDNYKWNEKKPYKNYLLFATDLDITVEDAIKYIIALPECYKKRFTIETGYRSGNKFKIHTTSTDPAVRLFFKTIQHMLLDLWKLATLKFEFKRGELFTREPAFKESVLAFLENDVEELKKGGTGKTLDKILVQWKRSLPG